jgi:hypothetical protein
VTRGVAAALAAAFLALSFVWYIDSPLRTTPGFFIDESSIAYNALWIARAGVDEHGQRMPVYFRAFGEYKNPVFIYLLAAVFKVAGPGILQARALSIVLGFLGALVMASLPRGWTARGFTFVAAIATPWLFETSRLVFEVAAFPLAIAAALWCVQRLARHPSTPMLLGSGAVLALLTYTYTAGRLLGPLMALGIVFIVPWRRAWIAWAAYAVPLVPALFNLRAVSARLTEVGVARGNLVASYFSSFSPWFLFVGGDPNGRHHVAFGGMLLVTVALAACGGLAVTIHAARKDPWSRYVLLFLAIAPLPGALAPDAPHALRLVTVGVLIVILAGIGIAALSTMRQEAFRFALILALFVALGAEAAAFRARYNELGPLRYDEFDAAYPYVMAAALQTGSPVGVEDAPYYIHAWWYGALRGIERERLPRYAKGREPEATVMLGVEPACEDCRVLVNYRGFIAYQRESSSRAGR